MLEIGNFTFVDRAEQADLKVEVVPTERVLADKAGFFTATEGRIGRIEIAAYGDGGLGREFYLRTILIHEIGHALGLDHLSEQTCNFMSFKNYICFTRELQECRSDSRDTRCIGVRLDQMRPLEKLVSAGPDKASARDKAGTPTPTDTILKPATGTSMVAPQPTGASAQKP